VQAGGVLRQRQRASGALRGAGGPLPGAVGGARPRPSRGAAAAG
jgi:hypothetical protein